jgi:hypothetical protein
MRFAAPVCGNSPYQEKADTVATAQESSERRPAGTPGGATIAEEGLAGGRRA